MTSLNTEIVPPKPPKKVFIFFFFFKYKSIGKQELTKRWQILHFLAPSSIKFQCYEYFDMIIRETWWSCCLLSLALLTVNLTLQCLSYSYRILICSTLGFNHSLVMYYCPWTHYINLTLINSSNGVISTTSYENLT